MNVTLNDLVLSQLMPFFAPRCLGKSRAVRPSVSKAKETTGMYNGPLNKDPSFSTLSHYGAVTTSGISTHWNTLAKRQEFRSLIFSLHMTTSTMFVSSGTATLSSSSRIPLWLSHTALRNFESKPVMLLL